MPPGFQEVAEYFAPWTKILILLEMQFLKSEGRVNGIFCITGWRTSDCSTKYKDSAQCHSAQNSK